MLDDPMTDTNDKNRRTAERVDAVVVLQLDEKGSYGVTRDVSQRGLLLATRVELKPGDTLEVTVHASDRSFKRNARVVRVEKTKPDEEWPFRVAMELDEAVPDDVLADGMRAATRLLR